MSILTREQIGGFRIKRRRANAFGSQPSAVLTISLDGISYIQCSTRGVDPRFIVNLHDDVRLLKQGVCFLWKSESQSHNLLNASIKTAAISSGWSLSSKKSCNCKRRPMVVTSIEWMAHPQLVRDEGVEARWTWSRRIGSGLWPQQLSLSRWLAFTIPFARCPSFFIKLCCLLVPVLPCIILIGWRAWFRVEQKWSKSKRDWAHFGEAHDERRLRTSGNAEE